LAFYNVFVHRSLRLLICLGCQLGVPKRTFCAHLKEKHHVSPAEAQRLLQVLETQLGTTALVMDFKEARATLFLHRPCRAIPGLEILPGKKCSNCGDCFSAGGPFSNHNKAKHNKQASSQDVLVQKVFHGCHSFYFHVIRGAFSPHVIHGLEDQSDPSPLPSAVQFVQSFFQPTRVESLSAPTDRSSSSNHVKVMQ
jgi:hypothetical protein